MSIGEDVSDPAIPEAQMQPDPFALLKRIHTGVARCAKVGACENRESIEYLWLYVSKTGIGQPDSGATAAQLSVEDWLNVVDEVASLGARWLVVSALSNLSTCPDIWTICAWGQDTHGMLVGLHTHAPTLTQEEIAGIQQLDPAKTRLLVNESAWDSVRPLRESGIEAIIVKPEMSEPDGECTKPGKMAFVNPQGEMYTCALVEGFGDFKLGNVFTGSMNALLRDPHLPHAVPSSAPHKEHGCAGCPPLMAQYFKNE
ncbi:MAG: SPASM domain-containing protein [Candidatus Hydrogenedentes bacterium]|nr:SPASM domain-containing protein [Candidatus Hydrogenedentota bacterium]